ncbi:DUF2785 domain-containing protein [Plantactinospora sp. BC1]|nr:DUF2785 domain-containing protein [Plantactinospora sp. BC1]
MDQLAHHPQGERDLRGYCGSAGWQQVKISRS